MFKENKFIEVYELVGLSNNKEEELWFKNENGYDYSMLMNNGNFKPILRPLSDLIKKIDVNGEKIIPIRELKSGGTDKEEVYAFEDFEGTNYVCSDNESHELVFNSNSGFNRRYNCESRQLNSYPIYQKLFEWHFDVFGLIEKGLAIDFNTL